VDNGTIRGNIAGQPIVVTSGQSWIGMIDINDRGEVVWPQDGGSNIYSNLRGQLTSDATGHEPAINNQGDVVFIQSEQVYKLAAGSSTPVQVTNNTFWHHSPAISDSGEIVWSEQDTSSSPPTNRIVSSTRGTLLTAIVDIYSVDLNNCGDIIYITSENSQNRLYRLGSNAPCVSYPGTNDILAQATPVAFGGIFTGLIDSVANPVDWYRFDATSGDSIHLTVNFDNRSPNVLNIGLYDGQGNLLSGPTAASPLGIVTTAAYSGAYYLKLEGQGGRFGYSVSLSKSSTNCGAGPCPDLIATGEFWSGASINSLGEVVWSQYVSGYSQLFSSTRGQLTNDEAYHDYPAINNLGDLVWVDNGTIRGNIAGQPIVVTSGQSWIGMIDINDRGEVVWPQDGGGSNIYSNLRGQLTSDATGHYEPAINNQGDVVFIQSEQVYKLAAGSSTPVQVTNNGFWHYSPAINDSGEIVWLEQDTSSSPRTNRIVSSTRGTLLTAIVDIYSVDLNNCGDIIYITSENSQSRLYRLGSNAPCVSYPGTNDILAQATPVAFGGIFTGLIDSVANPVDWYRFDATSGDSIHLTVNFDNRPPNVLNIGLYDGQGNLLSGPTAANPLGIVTTA